MDWCPHIAESDRFGMAITIFTNTASPDGCWGGFRIGDAGHPTDWRCCPICLAQRPEEPIHAGP